MKTIQQVIKETDHQEIETAYFQTHPIDLMDVTDHEDMTIKEYKDRVSKEFQKFLDNLCEQEIRIGEKDRGILFAYKSDSTEQNWSEMVALIHANELLNAEEVNSIETYAYEFTEQAEALGFLVADNKFTQDNLMDVIVDFLFEISFFGYGQEHLEEEKALLDEAVKEIEEHPERLDDLEPINFEKLREEWGLPTIEIYPEEKKKKDAAFEAVMDYTEYCKCIELERIKKALLSAEVTNG